MTVSNGKKLGFQWVSGPSVGFALVQLDSDKVALFSGNCSGQKTPDFSKPQLFAPDFFRAQDTSWWSFQNFELLSMKDLEEWASSHAQSAARLSWDEPAFSDFSAQVNKIEAAFDAHELHKAVPTVFAESERKDSDPSVQDLLARAILNRGHRYLYGLVLDQEGLMGATPETLFEFDGDMNSVESMALAGTRATEMESENPLLSDPKELHEHNLVLFEIKEKLQAFGEVISGETHCWDIGALSHLRTDIKVRLTKKDPAHVLFHYLEKALHPTPALGVASETLNFNWLKDLPGAKPRYRFGAPFGLWAPGLGAKVYVAIRNIQWTKDKWLLGSGCGYVPASQIDQEWKELQLKRASVRALFENSI